MIKHNNPDILKKITGGNLGLVLENLCSISKHMPNKIIIRIPIIPGFNDDIEIIDGIYKIALAHNVSTVHLLPYHMLGKHKFAGLGMEYLYKDDLQMMKQERLIPFRDYGESNGLVVKIG